MKKNPTLRELVKIAQGQGIDIGWRERKDGGIRITRIGGERFDPTLSIGNQALRRKLGVHLSSRRRKQLQMASEAQLPATLRKEWRKTRKVLQQSHRKMDVKISTVKKTYREKGFEATRKGLREIRKKARDLAPSGWTYVMWNKARTALDDYVKAHPDFKKSELYARAQKALSNMLKTGILSSDANFIYSFLYEEFLPFVEDGGQSGAKKEIGAIDRLTKEIEKATARASE